MTTYYKYTVDPFSQGRYLNPKASPMATGDPCAICGKLITNTANAVEAIVINGGADWGDEDSDISDGGFMGAWYVGPDCHRRYVAALPPGTGGPDPIDPRTGGPA